MFIWEVLVNGNERNGWEFLLRIDTALPTPAISLPRIHLWKTVDLHLIFPWLAFPHFYSASQEKIEPHWRKYLIWATD